MIAPIRGVTDSPYEVTCIPHADVAQLVEHHLAKVRVAGSNPVVRSTKVLVRPPLRRGPCHTLAICYSKCYSIATPIVGEGAFHH